MAEFQLADHLHKFHYEILEMPCGEFDKWFAYFEWKTEQEKKARKKANNKSGSSMKGNTTVTKY